MSSYDNTTTRSTERTRTEATFDAGLRRHMLRVYNYMASGILLTGIVALLCQATGVTQALYGKDGATFLGLVAIFAPLAYIFVLGKRLGGGSLAKGQVAFWSFTALMGVSMSTIFMQYTGTSIATTFFATAAAFAGLSLYGYTTSRSLTAMGSFLVMALWGLIVAMVINLFVGSGPMAYLLSAAGIVIFSGLTAYDTQKIHDEYSSNMSADISERLAIWGAVSLYLDFVNLMLSILRIFGVKTGD
jgi:FtsH-binding integral membrane protein